MVHLEKQKFSAIEKWSILAILIIENLCPTTLYRWGLSRRTVGPYPNMEWNICVLLRTLQCRNSEGEDGWSICTSLCQHSFKSLEFSPQRVQCINGAELCKYDKACSCLHGSHSVSVLTYTDYNLNVFWLLLWLLWCKYDDLYYFGPLFCRTAVVIWKVHISNVCLPSYFISILGKMFSQWEWQACLKRAQIEPYPWGLRTNDTLLEAWNYNVF